LSFFWLVAFTWQKEVESLQLQLIFADYPSIIQYTDDERILVLSSCWFYKSIMYSSIMIKVLN